MSKTILITGSSRGIGREIAKLFAYEKYNVIINYNNSANEASLLYDELILRNSNVLKIKADISNEHEVKKMISETFSTFNKIDILVNNAGISSTKLFTDITLEEWDEIFNVNVRGAYLCTKLVAKDMIKRKSGKIINISSIWGITGASCEVHYSSTKAAIIGFTKALAKELGPSNIQVNCVAPGVINTDMNNNFNTEEIKNLIEQTPLGRIGDSKDVADLVYYLASEKANFITGQVFSPNGGFQI